MILILYGLMSFLGKMSHRSTKSMKLKRTVVKRMLEIQNLDSDDSDQPVASCSSIKPLEMIGNPSAPHSANALFHSGHLNVISSTQELEDHNNDSTKVTLGLDDCDGESHSSGSARGSPLACALSEHSDSCLLEMTTKHKRVTFQDNIIDDLKTWAIESNVNHKQINLLLHSLKRYHPEIPLDARTLLNMPVTSSIVTIISNSSNAQFVYLGIQNNLSYQLDSGLHNILTNISATSIQLVCNVDGIPITKSTSAQFWPILCMVYLKDYRCPPFPVAIYYGNTKPVSLDQYLQDFINEINVLINNGLTYRKETYEIILKAIVCDAPARAFLKCIKGHTGFYSCERCHQKGNYINHRLVFPILCDPESVELRTDTNFRSQTLQEHHTGMSPMVRIDKFDIIQGLPLDYMHLACLGVCRRLLNIWCKGVSQFRLSPSLKEEISRYSSQIQYCIPTEFSRHPRSLSELDRWKATEFRLFSMYTGMILLKGKLPEKQYKHFLLFSIVLRILGAGIYGDDLGDIANILIRTFTDGYEKLYGIEELVYNVHSLQHMVSEVVSQSRKLDDISCFDFENYLGQMKKLLRQPNKPLQQVVRRIGEKQNNIKLLTFPSKNLIHNINPHNQKDCYIILKQKKVMKVTSVNLESMMYQGHVFSTTNCFFKSPLYSDRINIFKVSNLGTYKFTVSFNEVFSKCMVIPYENVHVALPILSSS